MPSLVKTTNAGRIGCMGSALIFASTRKSKAPEGGWHAGNFQGSAARRLQADIANVKRFAQARGMRMVTKFLSSYFERRITLLCDFALRMAPPDMKAMFHVGAHEDLWAQAMAQVFGSEADVEVAREFKPAIQSVVDETANKTTILLGGEAASVSRDALLRRANGLATQVTRINDTTRDLLARTINDGLAEDLTVSEMVKRIRERVPQIAENRIPTIARTEMGRAADEGVKAGIRGSQNVTYVSVVGCEAIEPGIPTYRGIPTCNIKDVPVADIDELHFHINHTGAIVPSKFREEDGAAKPTPTTGGAPELPEVPRGPERPAPHPIAKPYLLDDSTAEQIAASRRLLLEHQVFISENSIPEFQKDFKISPLQLRDELIGGIAENPIIESDFLLNRMGDREWHFVSKKGNGDDFEMQRFVSIPEKLAVHQYLRMTKQGAGVAKELLKRQLDFYDAVGINRIELNANIDVGGYAWARYGFTPKKGDWAALRTQLKTWAEMHAQELGPVAVKELGAIVENDSPTAIRQLATLKFQMNGETVGKAFLLGRSWDGEIRLDDPESYAIFKSYLYA